MRGMELLMDLALNLLTIVIKDFEKYVLDVATMFGEFGVNLILIQTCVNLSFGFSGKFGFSQYSDRLIK